MRTKRTSLRKYVVFIFSFNFHQWLNPCLPIYIYIFFNSATRSLECLASMALVLCSRHLILPFPHGGIHGYGQVVFILETHSPLGEPKKRLVHLWGWQYIVEHKTHGQQTLCFLRFSSFCWATWGIYTCKLAKYCGITSPRYTSIHGPYRINNEHKWKRR